MLKNLLALFIAYSISPIEAMLITKDLINLYNAGKPATIPLISTRDFLSRLKKDKVVFINVNSVMVDIENISYLPDQYPDLISNILTNDEGVFLSGLASEEELHKLQEEAKSFFINWGSISGSSIQYPVLDVFPFFGEPEETEVEEEEDFSIYEDESPSLREEELDKQQDRSPADYFGMEDELPF